jgi:hypothetical protein
MTEKYVDLEKTWVRNVAGRTMLPDTTVYHYDILHCVYTPTKQIHIYYGQAVRDILL